MDVLELNCILKTTDCLLNYGGIDATSHILFGMITSSLPFTFTALGDELPLTQLQYSVPQGQGLHQINVNSQFTTGLISKFQLKMEGSDFDINVKLWKPYPISPVLPEGVALAQSPPSGLWGNAPKERFGNVVSDATLRSSCGMSI